MSCPFPQQSHQPCAQTHHPKRTHHHPQPRPPHHATEHKLVRHQLHQARIDQDARTDRIKHPLHDQTPLATRRVTPPHGQAHRDRNRRRQAVPQREQIRRPAFRPRPGRGGETGAETEAFERLVEDEDDVEGVEAGAGDGEGEADEDGVEDDAEFEDEDCGHLRGVVFHLVVVVRGFVVGVGCLGRLGGVSGGGLVVLDVCACVAQVVFAGGVSLSDVGGGPGAADFEGVVVCVGFMSAFAFLSSVIMGVPDGAKGGEAHGH